MVNNYSNPANRIFAVKVSPINHPDQGIYPRLNCLKPFFEAIPEIFDTSGFSTKNSGNFRSKTISHRIDRNPRGCRNKKKKEKNLRGKSFDIGKGARRSCSCESFSFQNLRVRFFPLPFFSPFLFFLFFLFCKFKFFFFFCLFFSVH